MKFVNSDGLFDTTNISEVNEKVQGEYVLMPSPPVDGAKHDVWIRILADENDYKQWLIDLFRYLYRYKMDGNFTFMNMKYGLGVNESHKDWLDQIEDSCIRITKTPSWLENELKSIYNPRHEFFTALLLAREKYHHQNIYEEILGFRLRRYYKLENVIKILQDFEKRINVLGLYSLGQLLSRRTTEELEFKRDRHGNVFCLDGQNLGELIRKIRDELDHGTTPFPKDFDIRTENKRHRAKREKDKSGKGSQKNIQLGESDISKKKHVVGVITFSPLN